MLVIGLTGGIGSGKSTVAALFASHGVEIFDADQIARELLEPGQPGYEPVIAAFGSAILDPAQHIDRGRLGDIVFADADKLRRLESIVHPLVRSRLDSLVAGAGGPYCILCVPLLIETGMSAQMDRVLVVDVDPERQLQRLLATRPLDEQKARRIIAAQIDRDRRLQQADDIIDNNGPPEALAPQVALLHEKYRGLACGGNSD